MSGFFQKQEMISKSRPDGKILSCISCGGYKNCISKKIQPYGNFNKEIMIIGSGTTEFDDIKGKPFQGKEGRLLKKTLAENDISLFDDCILLNATRCYLTDKDREEREPSNYELDCCRKLVMKAIHEYKPKVIFLLGNPAIYSVIGHRWKKDLGKIDKWRGWNIPDQDFKAWICPVYDPKEVLEKSKPEINVIWENDIETGVRLIKYKFPKYKEPEITYLDDLSTLSKIKDDFSFDYETTGLKPHAKGHQIICASVAVSPMKVYTFMMPLSHNGRKPFTDLLINPKIGKIAQNMKYEDTWTNVQLGVQVENWIWDTMLASHIMDNRQGITSLKFQTYVQFGIVDYDSEVNPYLRAVDDINSNSINRIRELLKIPGGDKKLMKYCALDSIYEYRLAMLQRSIIDLPF